VVDLHQVAFRAPFLLNTSPRHLSFSRTNSFLTCTFFFSFFPPIGTTTIQIITTGNGKGKSRATERETRRERKDLAITLLKRRLHPLYNQPLVKRSPVTPASQPPRQDQLYSNSNKKECEKINTNVSYLINKNLSYLVLAGGPLSRRLVIASGDGRGPLQASCQSPSSKFLA
jgi:hypothetical protein